MVAPFGQILATRKTGNLFESENDSKNAESIYLDIKKDIEAFYNLLTYDHTKFNDDIKDVIDSLKKLQNSNSLEIVNQGSFKTNVQKLNELCSNIEKISIKPHTDKKKRYKLSDVIGTNSNIIDLLKETSNAIIAECDKLLSIKIDDFRITRDARDIIENKGFLGLSYSSKSIMYKIIKLGKDSEVLLEKGLINQKQYDIIRATIKDIKKSDSYETFMQQHVYNIIEVLKNLKSTSEALKQALSPFKKSDLNNLFEETLISNFEQKFYNLKRTIEKLKTSV